MLPTSGSPRGENIILIIPGTFIEGFMLSRSHKSLRLMLTATLGGGGWGQAPPSLQGKDTRRQAKWASQCGVPRGTARIATRSPLFFTLLLAGVPLSLCKPPSPRKGNDNSDPTEELGWEEKRWGGGRTTGKTQEEGLWSLRPCCGHFRDNCSFHPGGDTGREQEQPSAFKEMGP